MFIGELRIEKRWIRSRISGHLIVDRVSRKPQKKSTWRGAALPPASTAGRIRPCTCATKQAIERMAHGH